MSVPNVGDTISLPYKFPSPCALPQTIFITKAYHDLAAVIVSRFQYVKDKTSCEIMVSGTPGIGKSCFLTFLMLYLSKSTNVAYKYSSSVYYYDRKSSCCSLFYPFDYNFPGSENCVFLCDVSDTSFPLFTKLSFDCHAVFVSSPDQSKHKILKPFLSKSTYYLPLWTIDEMLNCRKVISHNLDDMEWKLRVERGGGY